MRLEISSSPVRAVIATMPADVGPGVGDELLGAVDHPARRRPGAARVRTLPASLPASGSVSPKAPSRRPAQRSGSQSRLLLLAAEQVDGLGAQRRVRAHRDRHRRVDAGELLDRERVAERVAPGAPVPPPGRGCPSSPARPASRRSRRGTTSSGRAPRPPARPRCRRTRGRSAGAGGGRRRGRRTCAKLRPGGAVWSAEDVERALRLPDRPPQGVAAALRVAVPGPLHAGAPPGAGRPVRPGRPGLRRRRALARERCPRWSATPWSATCCGR